jgi:hypothetical protein
VDSISVKTLIEPHTFESGDRENTTWGFISVSRRSDQLNRLQSGEASTLIIFFVNFPANGHRLVRFNPRCNSSLPVRVVQPCLSCFESSAWFFVLGVKTLKIAQHLIGHLDPKGD